MDALWLVWLGLALVAGVIEIFSLSLVFVMVAGGALTAAAVAALTHSVALSAITFAATSGLLMFAVRPTLLKYSRLVGPGTTTGVAALVGRQAEVIAEVTSRGGQVKIAGEIWSARSDRPGAALEIGSPVRVVEIDGATAVVSALPPYAALPGGANPSDGPEPLA
jgi:membrane protein implicated in regulation of membrane protease activity